MLHLARAEGDGGDGPRDERRTLHVGGLSSCHPERSEGSACRLKAAPASRVPARRYAPRDDNRSLSGLVRIQAIPSLLQHGAFDAHREDRRRHPEIPRRTQIWNEVRIKGQPIDAAGSNEARSFNEIAGHAPLAVSVAHLARWCLRSGKASLPQDVQALYVRPSDAELKEQCRD